MILKRPWWCTTALRQLPKPPKERDGSRNVAVLWLEALDHASLPPGEIAEIIREVRRRRTTEDEWLRPDALAAFLVPAAVGGHPQAANVLGRWSARAQPLAGKGATVRRIIVSRLQDLASQYPDAYVHLIRDARVETDGRYLLGAITKPHARNTPVPEQFVGPVTEAARQLLSSRLPDTRAQGYAIAAAADHGRDLDYQVIVSGVTRERGVNALNAALNLVTATLDHTPQRWSEDEPYHALESALDRVARGECPTPEIVERAATCLLLLYCRSAPLHTAVKRERVINRVWELVSARKREVLTPLRFLMSRLAKADHAAAGDLLVAASATVHRTSVADTTNSWKTRRARRWRVGISDILRSVPYEAWKDIIDRLAMEDPNIFVQAVDVSLQHRREDVETYLRQVNRNTSQDYWVNTELHNAITRRQRVTGGTTTWPKLLDISRRTPAGRN